MNAVHIFKNHFELNLLTELGACPVVVQPSGAVLRQPENTHIRYTPLVVKGAIKVTRIDDNNREILLYTIKAGESCFLTIMASAANNFATVSHLRAVCEEDTTMISVTDEQIRDWNEKYRSWRNFVAQMYNNRFADFFAIMDNIAFKNMEERLNEVLSDLAKKQNPIPITHQALANQLATAREVVSRLLKKMEQNGRLELGRNKIYVKY
jgi:CRP/FNR family transcriptional regulator, anaerobic regulatory protein